MKARRSRSAQARKCSRASAMLAARERRGGRRRAPGGGGGGRRLPPPPPAADQGRTARITCRECFIMKGFDHVHADERVARHRIGGTDEEGAAAAGQAL